MGYYEKVFVNEKGEKVVMRVALPVRDEDKQSDPQLYLYFLTLFCATHILSVMITIGPSFSKNKDYAFHGGIFLLMANLSFSVVLMASGVLIFTSQCLQNWMNDFCYTILKTMGSFSAINTLFSVGAVFWVPEIPDWKVYLVMLLIFICILAMDYLLWKYVCTQQNRYINTVHWTLFLTSLLPLSIAMWQYIPPSLFSTWYVVTGGTFIVAIVAGYCSVVDLINPESDLTRKLVGIE